MTSNGSERRKHLGRTAFERQEDKKTCLQRKYTTLIMKTSKLLKILLIFVQSSIHMETAAKILREDRLRNIAMEELGKNIKNSDVPLRDQN